MNMALAFELMRVLFAVDLVRAPVAIEGMEHGVEILLGHFRQLLGHTDQFRHTSGAEHLRRTEFHGRGYGTPERLHDHVEIRLGFARHLIGNAEQFRHAHGVKGPGGIELQSGRKT